MAFHSLKESDIQAKHERERSSQRDRRVPVITGEKRRSGSRRRQDIGEVQIKNE